MSPARPTSILEPANRLISLVLAHATAAAARMVLYQPFRCRDLSKRVDFSGGTAENGCPLAGARTIYAFILSFEPAREAAI
jgi:hypothetical protein